MQLKHDRLLSNILRTLVDEWGYKDVREQLDALASKKEADNGKNSIRHKNLDQNKDLRRKISSEERVAKKIDNFLTYANNLSMSNEKRTLLSVLMNDIKNKSLLPTTKSIQLFFANQGIRANVNNRADAIEKIFDLFVNMSEDRIKNAIKYEINSGPASLSLISDAISAKRNILRGEGEQESAREYMIDKEASPKNGDR